MPQSPRPIKLGRFQVDARIAVGGMATVYRARLRGAGGFARSFALKVIHPHLVREEGFLDRFYDEARVASRIRHPNVVSTVGIEQAQRQTFLVLELIDGVTLRELSLRRDAPFPCPEAARIVADAARGLHAVHTVADDAGAPLEAIHRDISPHNLMLDTEGHTILIDLGLVKARGQLGHTQTGVLAGKLPYMSPEQSLLLPLEARSDVFSLGSVLFELVTGELPFGDDQSPDTLDRLRTCDRSALAVRLESANVEPWLSSVILACLHHDPAERFASALALAEAIEDELQNVGATDAEVRRWIATHARVTREALPFVDTISPDELGIVQARPNPRGYLWGALGVAAAAVAAYFGASAWQQSRGQAVPEPASLATDAVVESAAPQPALEVTAPSPTQSASEAALRSGAGDLAAVEEVPPVELEPAEKRVSKSKRRRRPKAPAADAPKLKDNPYTGQP